MEEYDILDIKVESTALSPGKEIGWRRFTGLFKI
jgi:hypothetical protein